MSGEDRDRTWTDDTGETYASLGQYRRQASQTGPDFDPAEDSPQTASRLEIQDRFQRLVAAGLEEEAQRLRPGSDDVASVRDQQRLSVQLIRKHDLAED